jgi:hypothetical protein
MPGATDLEQRIQILFGALSRRAAFDALPPPGTLSQRLGALIEKSPMAVALDLTPDLACLFATAAVEIWQRGVHSLLISASLTAASPVWSSVAGYYASHYSVRGLAHLLGFFQLHRKQRILSIDIVKGRHVCHVKKKQEREHKFYWKAVKSDVHFANDPFFTYNSEETDVSDASHRSWANYCDHINSYPLFTPLDEQSLRRRIERLSTMNLSSAPIPSRGRYPDLDTVQLVAYHRIIKFRSFLDGFLGGSNRFWRVHRTPSWCSKYLKFQVVAPAFIEVYKTQP